MPAVRRLILPTPIFAGLLASLDGLNPYEPAATKTQAENELPQAKVSRPIALTAFIIASSFVLTAYVAANFYARSYDPWLTPRFTHYMLLWRRIGTPMLRLMMMLVPSGLFLVLFLRATRHWIVVGFLIAAMVAAPILLGIP